MDNRRKEKAIVLRKKGKTYAEILSIVPVAKSTLAIWLGEAGLTEKQEQVITEKRRLSALKGAHARRATRLAEIKTLIEAGKKDVGQLSDRELWLVGIALHWAEGAKQRDSALSTGIRFTNSDPEMLVVFLRWLKVLHIPQKDISYQLYAHENRKADTTEFIAWWRKKLKIPKEVVIPVYFKKEKIRTNRQNTTDLYHGLIRITVRASTSRNRQINGWVQGIVHQ